MEFACSHFVCNWMPDGADGSLIKNEYDNVVAVKQQEGPVPPPVPPRRFKKPRPTSLPPPPPSHQPPPTPLSLPPPVPPRAGRLKANVNVVSLSVGQLVQIRQATGPETFQSPVNCGKCGAALSALSSTQGNAWHCEFCGCENILDDDLKGARVGQGAGVRSDDLYLPNKSDDDYQNLEDSLVVYCVDISGSMSVTTEVTSSSGFPAYVSRLESIQDALQRALSSMLQHSPHRRVALVTFGDEVVIYGDGTSMPVTLRDWALVDHDHIWEQGAAYSIPHCISETYHQLIQRVRDFRENGATSLGPAALASVAMASRYPGSKVILCTDGRANIGLGKVEPTSSLSASALTPYFYKQLALRAMDSGVIISVMSFEGTDCRLADIGRLADATGGRVNIVTIGTIATEIQSASMDNVLATGVKATLLAPDGTYFPHEEDNSHKLVREIGNVTSGLEITFQFAVKPEFMAVYLQTDTLPFQLQLSFKNRDQQKVIRVITEKRPVISCSRIGAVRFNMAVLGVHSAQLCATLTMEGRVHDAQRQLKAQQDLLLQISKHRPEQQQESIYGNWMDTMTTICDDITADSLSLSDEAANIVYQMKRVTSVSNTATATAAAAATATTTQRKPMALAEGM